jgi:hypothetical protein
MSSKLKGAESRPVVVTIASHGRNNYNLQAEAEFLPNPPIRNYGTGRTMVRKRAGVEMVAGRPDDRKRSLTKWKSQGS